MNLVFVNHMHPSTPHVSGMRSWYFAQELAKRGHRVVQVCEWREGAEPAPETHQLALLLQAHDWAEPLLLPIRPQSHRLLNRIRSARTPFMLRKGLVLWSYLRSSGMFTDFSSAVTPYLGALAQEFKPQVTWGLFGNTDCWLIAQRLSRMADCPWIADMKDSWEVFMRRPLRKVIARRFKDMAGCTANAEFNARVLEAWFPPKPAVVYSGVASCFHASAPGEQDAGVFRLTLTGSVHDVDGLQRFVGALMEWLRDLARSMDNGTTGVEIVYAGADSAKIASALRPVEDLARVQVKGYLPLTELAALCRSATVNAYIWNRQTFHHKLLELLSCGRPVIAFPGETNESRRLAEASGGVLVCPANEDELVHVLRRISDEETVAARPGNGQDLFSWGAQAERLEAVFVEAVRKMSA